MSSRSEHGAAGGVAAVLLIAVCAGCNRTPVVQKSPPTYVGRAACAECHAPEAKAYAGSDHDRAMQPGNASTVQGDFNGARFAYNGITTTFFRNA